MAFTLLADLIQLPAIAFQYDGYPTTDGILWEYFPKPAVFHPFNKAQWMAIWYTALAITGLWLFIAGYVQITIAHPEQRLRYLKHLPYLESIAFFLCNTCFFFVVIVLMRMVDCIEIGETSYVFIVPDPSDGGLLECWKGDHRIYGAVSLMAVSLYVLSANSIGGLFYDNISPKLDLQVTSSFLLLERCGKFAVAFVFIHADEKYYAIPCGISALVFLVLLGATYFRPSAIKLVTYTKGLAFGAALCVCVSDLIGIWVTQAQDSWWTLIVLLIGWGFGLLLWFILMVTRRFSPSTAYYLQGEDEQMGKVAGKAPSEQSAQGLLQPSTTRGSDVGDEKSPENGDRDPTSPPSHSSLPEQAQAVGFELGEP
jgi:hypothetical protein